MTGSSPDPVDAYRADLLAGRHVFISGGGTGLGAAMAARLAQLGAAITICGRRRSPLDETAAAIRDAGGKAEGIPCDITKRHRVEQCLDEAEQRSGPVTDLINNAAGNFLALSEDLDPRGFEAVTNINLFGSFHCTQACGQRWIERETGGNVVAIATTYTDTGAALVMPSATTKAAIVAMMRSLAVEWGPYGIRLNSIAPGPIPTKGAWDRLIPDASFEDDMRKTVPLGRFATKRELADLAAYLLSDLSAMITGQLIELDGGARLAGHGSFNDLLRIPRDELRSTFDALRPRRRRTPTDDDASSTGPR